MSREKLFSVTASDCEFTPYKGSGAGGQKKNKTESAMRCVHPPSGAVGECEDHREQPQNKKESFKRMVKSEKFQTWLRIEIARQTGRLAEINAEIEREMKRVKVEVKDENGRWVQEEKSEKSKEKA